MLCVANSAEYDGSYFVLVQCFSLRDPSGGISYMPLTIETELETDGRWIAEVPELPGVLAYGPTRAEAVIRAEELALCVLADRKAN